MEERYEQACRDAGLSDEKTAEIRRLLDRNKKKLRYEKKLREKLGVVFNSLEAIPEYDPNLLKASREQTQVEEIVIRKEESVRLAECIGKLGCEEQELLLIIYRNDTNPNGKLPAKEIARILGMSRATFFRKKKELKRKFSKILNENGIFVRLQGDFDSPL